MNIPDQNVLLALLNLAGALAHKLTGEHPMLCIEDELGNIHHFVLGISGVQWFKDPMKATCCIHTDGWFNKHLPQVNNNACSPGSEAFPPTLTESQASGAAILS